MSQEDSGLLRHVGLRSATALVVANMIGAGIFTTTGFQAEALGHPGYIFLLWIVGGILALCGALCFAELGAAMPEAGAEYVYLRETYGQAFAFMSAFVSLVAGFSAPIAAAAEGFVKYAAHFVPILAEDTQLIGQLHSSDLVALILVWSLVAMHSIGVRVGIGFTDLVTLFKVTGILAIILAAFAFGKGNLANLTTVSPEFYDLSTVDTFSAFATSLIFVTFCYLGWNASAYLAAEMKHPQRDLPRSLLLGTALVTALYLAINAVYFYGAATHEMAGTVEVGITSATTLFGPTGVALVTSVICVSILASASAMTVAGPRVYYAFGKDCAPLRFLARTGPKTGAPTPALVLQGVVISIIIFMGNIDQIIQYAGFTLTLFSSLAVACVIVLRIRRPDMPRPFRVWGYPWPPLLYLSVSVWVMVWAAHARPIESFLALATVCAGGLLFVILPKQVSSPPPG